MEKLKYYKKNYGTEEPEEIFKIFIDTLRYSISNWSYFVNWNKIKKNIYKYKVELNLLNSIIGSTEIEKEFIELCKRYPDVKLVLPLLVAIRYEKINKVSIFEETTLEVMNAREVFTSSDSDKLLDFFTNSGLKELFQDRSVKNLVDYVMGVEVGMDTNARKNRIGKLMEEIVEKILKEFVDLNGYEYGVQMSTANIKKRWNIQVPSDKSKRKFDFVINVSGKLFLFEVNFYSGGGSKLKATAGEYIGLNNLITNAGFDFIWITDGAGWKTEHNHIEAAFYKNKYVFNLKMLSEGILEEIIK